MTQQQGGTGSGGTGGSGDQQQATWFDSFADIKGDQALATTAARYKSPAEVLESAAAERAFGTMRNACSKASTG